MHFEMEMGINDLICPDQIAINERFLFVIDIKCLKVFDSENGVFVRKVGKQWGPDNSQLDGVSIDDKFVYVMDSFRLRPRINVYSQDTTLEFVRSMYINEDMKFCAGKLRCGVNGLLYVVHKINNVICVYEKNTGKQVGTIDQVHTPKDISCTEDGLLYVAEYDKNCVKVFCQYTHKYVRQFGSEGTKGGQFITPVSVCVDVYKGIV